jgi:hypothetical protein
MKTFEERSSASKFSWQKNDCGAFHGSNYCEALGVCERNMYSTMFSSLRAVSLIETSVRAGLTPRNCGQNGLLLS